jgi:myosin heavy subunit
MRIHEFARRFWQDVARNINPRPKSLIIEVNPALKTNYRKEYRTYVVTLELGVSVTDMISQAFLTGPAFTGGYDSSSSYVEAIQQREALKQEAEAMARLAQAAAQEAQMETLNPQQGMTQMQKDLLEGQKRRDMEEAQRLQQQAEATAEAAQKIEEKIQQVAEGQIAEIEEKVQEGIGEEVRQEMQQQQSVQQPVQPGQPAQGTAAVEQPNPSATAEVKTMEQEERQSDIGELNTVRRILRDYRLRIARGPMLENDVTGDKIVFEVWADSFSEGGINPYMQPVIMPSF